MKTATRDADTQTAPQDYDDFFRRFRPYVVSLVRRAGIDPHSAEDVASEIMIRFMEKDLLADFDPTLTFLYNRQIRHANFKSFLSKWVLRTVLGFKDKQKRLMEREHLLVDMPTMTEDGNSWVDARVQVDSAEETVLTGLGYGILMAEMRAHLETVPKSARKDAVDLVALFDECARQMDDAQDAKRLNLSALRDHFGCSSTAINTWIWKLREHLAGIAERAVPPKRTRTMKACG